MLLHRLLWYVCVVVAIILCSSLAQKTWKRFQTSPTVITMDRNKFFWNTSFPSLTVCPHTRIDDTKVDAYMLRNPHVFANVSVQSDFRHFVVLLANMTYDTIDELPMDNTFGIQSQDYLELLWNLTWSFQPEVASMSIDGHRLYLQDVVSEMGICYTFNSKISTYSSYRYSRWQQLYSIPFSQLCAFASTTAIGKRIAGI